MKGVIIIGRGGQGVKSGAAILAKAASEQGLIIQAFPEYGPERMGAPVKSFIKISREAIRSFSHIKNPDYVLLIDNSLIRNALEILSKDSVLVVNDVCEPAKYNTAYKIRNKVLTVDATGISLKELGSNKPNVPILGALLKAEPLVSIDSLKEAVKEFFGSKGKSEAGEANMLCVKRAYDEARL